MREEDHLVTRGVEAYRVYCSTFSESMESRIREKFGIAADFRIRVPPS